MRMNKKLKNVLAFGLATSFVLTSTMGALATDDASEYGVATYAADDVPANGGAATDTTVVVPVEINFVDYSNGGKIVYTWTTSQEFTDGIPADGQTFEIPSTVVPSGYEVVGDLVYSIFPGFTSVNSDIEVKKQAEEVAPEVEKTATINFNVDPDKGEFPGYDGKTTLTFKDDENSDTQYNVPVVKAKDGWTFTGWSISGATEGTWDANASTFYVGGLAYYQEGATEGYATITATFEEEEKPEVKKTATINFNVDPDKGEFPGYDGETTLTYQAVEGAGTQYAVPKVKAKDGWKFTGWSISGATEGTWDADASTFYVDGLAYYQEGKTEGYATITATFAEDKKPEEEKRTVNVTFNVDPEKGEFTDPAGAEVVTFNGLDEYSDEQYNIPTVKGINGYKFVGWKGQGAGVIEWSADAKTFGVTGLAFFAEGSKVGYASIEAVFEKEEEPAPETRTVNVYFSVDPEKGSFPAYAPSTVVSFENLDEFSDQQFEIPAVEAKEGYKFVGWKGQGADVIEWDADATTFGVTGLAFFAEGSNVGYASVEAVFEKEEEPAPETRTVNVYFAVDPEKGSFPAYAPSTVVSFENLDEFSDQQFEIPAVEAKEGYKFVGWKGQGADVIEWDADAKTFGVTGLAFFEEGSNVGNASVEAVFEKVEPETETETTTETETETTTETETEPTTTEPATEAPTTESEKVTDAEEETTEEATTEEETETDKKTVVTEKNNKSDDNSKKTSDSAVKTGDTTTVMPYVIALFAAAALIVVLALKKRRTF